MAQQRDAEVGERRQGAGQQQLRFEYRRPWELDVAPSQVATYAVTVK